MDPETESFKKSVSEKIKKASIDLRKEYGDRSKTKAPTWNTIVVKR